MSLENNSFPEVKKEKGFFEGILDGLLEFKKLILGGLGGNVVDKIMNDKEVRDKMKKGELEGRERAKKEMKEEFEKRNIKNLDEQISLSSESIGDLVSLYNQQKDKDKSRHLEVIIPKGGNEEEEKRKLEERLQDNPMEKIPYSIGTLEYNKAVLDILLPGPGEELGSRMELLIRKNKHSDIINPIDISKVNNEDYVAICISQLKKFLEYDIKG